MAVRYISGVAERGERAGRADFADYLIGDVAADAGCDETATFDRRLRGSQGFKVL